MTSRETDIQLLCQGHLASLWRSQDSVSGQAQTQLLSTVLNCFEKFLNFCFLVFTSVKVDK